MTISFMKHKLKEYDELKLEINKLQTKKIQKNNIKQ